MDYQTAEIVQENGDESTVLESANLTPTGQIGGDCKTLMFVQISPSDADLGDTLCSLNFASRVKGIEHGPARKQTDHSELLKYKHLAEKSKHDEKETKITQGTSMETPSSSRRITRSQAAILANNATSNTKTSEKLENSEMGVAKSRQRSSKQPLVDITNDSPIVGLASGSLKQTPVSSVSSKQRCSKTPGSGEALLRGQVKNLLNKVEEEAEISKFSLGPLRTGFKAIFNSPACLVAPTPVNTPQVLNFSIAEESDSLSSVSEPPIEDQIKVMSGIIEGEKEKEGEKEVMISRTLFLDFSESDSSSECSSVVTYQGTIGGEREVIQEKTAGSIIDDDDASMWSIQVNASTRDEDEDEGEVNQDGVEEHENVTDGDDVSFLDELCEGISKISVKEGPKFMGKHVRFVYNSDDELVEECEDGSDSADVLKLKGLPTPKGGSTSDFRTKKKIEFP